MLEFVRVTSSFGFRFGTCDLVSLCTCNFRNLRGLYIYGMEPLHVEGRAVGRI